MIRLVLELIQAVAFPKFQKRKFSHMFDTFPKKLGTALSGPLNTLLQINGWLTRPMKSRTSANDWSVRIPAVASYSARCGINKEVAVIGTCLQIDRDAFIHMIVSQVRHDGQKTLQDIR